VDILLIQQNLLKGVATGQYHFMSLSQPGSVFGKYSGLLSGQRVFLSWTMKEIIFPFAYLLKANNHEFQGRFFADSQAPGQLPAANKIIIKIVNLTLKGK